MPEVRKIINRRIFLQQTAAAGVGGLALGAGPMAPTVAARDVQFQVLGLAQPVETVVRKGTTSDLVNPPSGLATTLTFNASAWQGGWHRNDSGFLGRPWTALYGAQSAYPQAALVFSLTVAPTGPMTLTLTGISDESGVRDRIGMTVNNETIYTGPAWFAGWNGVGTGQDAIWTTVVVTLPASLFQRGVNQISIANQHPGANFGKPPYVDLGAARLVIPGAGGSVITNVTGR